MGCASSSSVNERIEVPEQMESVYLEEFAKPTASKTVETPKPQEGELLIKVHAAPINPADMLFLAGHYLIDKKAPCIPGLEGSGIVCQGKGKAANSFVGKRVAFLPTNNQYGSFGEYVISAPGYVIELPKNVSFEQGATSFVNPVTVLCMLETVQKEKVKAVIHTAAASQLGRMMVKYFQKNGVEVINVVRRQEQVDLLKNIGAKHVLNQTDEDFDKQLTELATQLNAKIAFDAISGEMTGRILTCMPKGSTVYVYGGLSGGNPGGVQLGSLLFDGKFVSGYWLQLELESRTPEQSAKLFKKVPAMLTKEFESTIAKSFTHEEFAQGLEYYQQNQTQGKVIIGPKPKAPQEKVEEKAEDKAEEKQEEQAEEKKEEQAEEKKE